MTICAKMDAEMDDYDDCNRDNCIFNVNEQKKPSMNFSKLTVFPVN